jgi:hypothetical protein
VSARCPDCEAPAETVDDLLEHYRRDHPGQGTYQPPAIEEFRRRVNEWSTRDDVEAAAVMVRYVWDRLVTRSELGSEDSSSSR